MKNHTFIMMSIKKTQMMCFVENYEI